MDVRLSAEQQALRDSAAQVLADLGPSAVGHLEDTDRAAKLDAAVTAAGWRDLRAPDAGGNPWASGVEVCLVAEQLARGLADTAFIGPTLTAELRRRTGARSADERETVAMLPRLTALAEARDPGAVAVDAAEARAALALAAQDDGWRVASVALGPASVRVDLTRPTASLEGTPMPVGGRVLDSDDLLAVAALGLALACADLVGTMQGAVDLASGYAAERRQYGQPIGAFQAVQHLLADAFVATEGARSAALHAAWAVDALPPAEAVIAGSVAKAYAARAARSVCETAIQVHGGMGNTWECLAHVHLRRALLSAELFGGVDASLQRVLAHHVGADRGLR
jgi:alkylation response protein AidB-like acyl-CoA dehydrogenase